MRKIWKYELKTVDEQVIKIPFMSGNSNNFKDQVLKIDVQNGIPCLWCLVDQAQEIERTIYIIGTGNTMPKEFTKDNYIGSYQLYGGSFVGHVFV